MPSSAAAVDSAKKPLTLLLQLDPRIGVDATELRARLHNELGHDFQEESSAPDGRLQIQQQGENEVRVRYQLHSDPELVRSVALPLRTGERADVLFWLVSNLVSDQMQGLLDELAPPANPSNATTGNESSAPPIVTAPARPNKAQKPPASRALPPLELFNLSLFHPITLVPHSETKRFRGELGLAYSRVYGISGVGVTAGALRIDGPTEGALFAGLYAQWAGTTQGYVASGLMSYGSAPLVGVVNSGLLTVHRAEATGAVISGVINLNQDVTGFQTAGVLNVADNVAGAQVSLVNIGGHVEGVQIGLVNISEELTGMPIGLVNVVQDARHQAETWVTVQDTSSGYRSSLVLGYKNLRGPLYTLVSVGMASSLQANLSDAAPLAQPTFATASSGLGVQVGKEPLYAAADVQYFVEADTRKSRTPRHGVEYRFKAGLDFGSFGGFAGVGARQTFENASIQLAHEALAGLSFF